MLRKGVARETSLLGARFKSPPRAPPVCWKMWRKSIYDDEFMAEQYKEPNTINEGGNVRRMKALRSLDAHAHLDPVRTSDELASSGAVLAMAISLDEAALVVDRHEPQIVWGIGCHPRKLRSQESFDAEEFGELRALSSCSANPLLQSSESSIGTCDRQIHMPTCLISGQETTV